MKYYNISWTDDISEIGHYPQTIVNTGFNVIEKNINISDSFIKNGSIEINSNAKPTNFLAREPLSEGFIIDNSFKLILEQFNIPSHGFYPIPTQHKGEYLDYYWFKFVPSIRHIDYEKSTMQIYRNTSDKVIGEFAITSIDFKNRISKALSFEESFIVKEIVLKDSFPLYDVFSINGLSSIDLISEKLLDRLIKEKMTGFSISENKKINCAQQVV